MKTFLFAVFVWFLFQIVFVSAAGQMNSDRIHNLVATGVDPAQAESYVTDGCDESPVLAFLAGAVFPITEFSFVSGEYCWDN